MLIFVLVTGFNGTEVLSELLKLRLMSLLDSSVIEFPVWGASSIPNPLEDVVRFTSRFGFFKGQIMEDMVDELIHRKTGTHHMHTIAA
jgi:hypothetical protein